jgi:lipid A 3-O-deacylase
MLINIFRLIITIVAISSPVYAENHSKNLTQQLGISIGNGKPDSLTSLRIHYRHQLLNKNNLNFSADFSFAHLHSKTHDPNNIDIFAISPVINYSFYEYNSLITYFEFSVGPARKSTKQVGTRCSGSKWTFQDILGIGIKSKSLDLRITYMHYSNGSLAKPNPGIDIWPMFSIAYQF